ncbi:centromere protein K-like protein [Cricetulus griseus]|uniref:Centromere protein K-like protein n=1 Tax=Cricetulus griseus TaxID=10029 RepID=A0A061IF24_CRIGR|nr:centromere protein K-like protein [Cricetulus griseus]
MLKNQQELDPDITADMEVIDTEEELIKQCEEIWKDMEDVSINSHHTEEGEVDGTKGFVYVLYYGATCMNLYTVLENRSSSSFVSLMILKEDSQDLVDSLLLAKIFTVKGCRVKSAKEKDAWVKLRGDELSLLIMQVKCLTAELGHWKKRTPEITPMTEDILVTLGKEEFQKLRHNLEMVVSTIQSKNEKLKEDLEREQQWLDEQQQILESLNVLHSDLKNQVVTFSESRIFNELKAKMLSIKEFKEKLLCTLGEFLEDHFPLPDGTIKKKKMLINRMFEVPHDPYVKISDSFWPPYIELLLRYGIALRHPEDPTRIRLEAFHQ